MTKDSPRAKPIRYSSEAISRDDLELLERITISPTLRSTEQYAKALALLDGEE